MTNTVTDGRGIVTTLTYDSNKHPLTTKTASHPVITYSYNTIGWMESLTDQEGTTTSFTYYNNGRLKTSIDPLTKITSYIYDDAGRITSRTDRNNNTTTYAYTPTDKLQTVTYPDTSTVTFTYNLHDKPTSMQDTVGTTTYTYDELYRLKSMSNPYGQVISYEYDANGNVTKLTYPGNKSVTYTYNKLNRLQTVKNWMLQTVTYTYDDAGRLTSLINFNGTVTNYGYDNANRLVSLQNKPSSTVPVISSYNFTLDGNGNRTQVLQQEPLMPAMPLESIDYNYNSVKNRLLSAGLTNFTYDDEGQLASKSSDTYSFDYEHRLKTVIANPSGEAISFTYDGGGNRLQATRNSTVTRYIYDARGNLLAEADSANNITRYYIYGLGLLAMVNAPTAQVYTYHYNGIGSTIAMTDQSKNMVNKYFYTAFGLLTNEEETIPQPFKYVAQYGIMYEPGGLYYMRARYYDAETGRFISEDPVGFDGGINLYAYVNNNPINLVDPLGLAYFGKRPLAGREDMINNPVLDVLNLEVSHEQIIFDQPQFVQGEWRTDIGFGPNRPDIPTGLFSEGVTLDNLGNYQITGPHYDDALVAQAVNNIGGGWWNVVLHNCQDWTGEIRWEYTGLQYEQGKYNNK